MEARRDLAAATAAPAVGAVEDRTVAGPEGAPPIPVRVYHPPGEPARPPGEASTTGRAGPPGCRV
ncbi:hypothetical protein GPZ77_04110 [Streptomyces sp. QHH-9511]|uniref:hypothetical protein n=1 Tax=Streptomyces sp. QHH-9511 TaxID=2684468 RepID=UPI001315F17B|nr:hypothetical protein [Streptomyces sp. QHH-9511]QGZ47676.1 hypothetical protein GPZ77_04110 [Streptomyces sp. QHH-9511]